MKSTPALRLVLIFTVVLLATIHLLVIAAFPYLNHDVAQYLSAGQVLAGGGLPYVDVIDTNPPMIIYLSAIPAFIAGALQLPLAATGLWFWTAIIAAVLGYIGWVSKRTIPGLTSEGLLFSLAVWVLLSLFLYLQSVFAQRDEIVFLFLVPFLLVRYGRYELRVPGRAALVASAVLAALAVAMKPLFLLTILAGEAGLVLLHRTKLGRLNNLEVLWFGCLALLSSVHTLVIPAMASPSVYWISRILGGYRAYNASFGETLSALLTDGAGLSLLVVLILVVAGIGQRKNPLWRAGALFGFAGCANAVVALIQMKGWIYHTVPLILSAGFGAGFLMVALPASRPLALRMSVWLTSIAVLSFAIIVPDLAPGVEAVRSGSVERFPESEMTRLIRESTGPADRVMILDTGVGGGYPDLTYTGRRPAGRFLSAFPIAFFAIGAKGYQPDSALQEDADRYYAMLTQDVRDDRPVLIFILEKSGATALPKEFRISEYLRRQGFSDFLAGDYLRLGKCGDFDVFRRMPESALIP